MSNLLLQGVPPYLGTKANTPPNAVLRSRRPVSTDINYSVNDFWIYNDPTPGSNFQELWFLASLKGNGNVQGYVAKWVLLSDSAGGGVLQLTTDDAVQIQPILGNINLYGSTNIHTTGDIPTGTARVFLNDSILLPATTGPNAGVIALGTDLSNDRFIHNYSPGGSFDGNTFIGRQSGNFTLTNVQNTGCGNGTLASLTDGIRNSAFGFFALSAADSAEDNCAFGWGSQNGLIDGVGNVAMGRESLGNLLGGTFNIAIGNFAGSQYVNNEGSNILIGNVGLTGEDNTIRIGTPGAGDQTQDLCYVAGITGHTITNESPNKVVNVGTDGELGEVELQSSGGTVTITQPSPGIINFEAAGGGGGGTNPFSFSYVQTTDIAPRNVNTPYDLGSEVILTQLFDVGGLVFPGDGLGAPAVFTAPVTGKYYFELYISISSTNAGAINTTITTTSRTYSRREQGSPSTTETSSLYTVVTDMTMGQTATFTIDAFLAAGVGTYIALGNGGQNINSTRISGFLIPEDGTGGSFAQPFLGIQAIHTGDIWPGSTLIPDYEMGSAAAMNGAGSYDVGANFFPGTGAGGAVILLPATFTAPATGIYEFSMGVIFASTGGNTNNQPSSKFFGLKVNGIKRYWTAARSVSGGDVSSIFTWQTSLTINDVVTFVLNGSQQTTAIGVAATANLGSNPAGGPAVNPTFVSGYRIA